MNCQNYLRKYEELLRADAKRLLPLNLPQITRDSFEQYFITGNRINYEKIYFGRREFLTVFGLLSILESLDKTKQLNGYSNIEKLFDCIYSILDEPTWILPPHGSMDNFDNGTPLVDLFAAETAGSIAEILYLIKEHTAFLNSSELSLRYHQLCQDFYAQWNRRIYSFFNANDPCAWWEYGDMNWSTVCAGNIAISAYYLTKLGFISRELFIKVATRTCKSMESYISSLGEEGVCTEGMGYYKYGMEYFLAWHEIIKNSMPEFDFNLQLPDFSAAALFPQNICIGKGLFVNFSDSGLHNPMKMGLLAYISSCYDSVRLPDYYVSDDCLLLNDITEVLGGHECHRFAGALRDYLWVDKYGKFLKVGGKDLELSIYDKHMWYVRRFQNGTCLYGKGGHNDEPHNHNDIGSFACLFEGQEILCDLGPGEYVKGYFDENRYTFLCNSSDGHSVPIISDRLQLPGKEFKAGYFKGNTDGFEIHFGKAYDFADDSVIRRIKIDNEETFSLEDHIDFSSVDCNSYSEVFITRTAPIKIENSIIIPFVNGSGINKQAVLTFDSSVLDDDISIENLSFNEHEGSPTPVFRIRIYVKKPDFKMIISSKSVN